MTNPEPKPPVYEEDIGPSNRWYLHEVKKELKQIRAILSRIEAAITTRAAGIDDDTVEPN